MQERHQFLHLPQEITVVPAELLTATQVGRLLDVDTSTVYRMAGDGRLPAVRVGRQWRFPAERIAQMLETGVPGTAAVPPPATNGHRPATVAPDLLATVLELVAESLGVMMVVTDMHGRPLTRVANPCRWFADHGQEPEVVAECVEEWRDMARELDLVPRFRMGRHGFLCARTFVRQGTELVWMVLAGGIAPDGDDRPADGLFHLDDESQDHVLAMLPRVAASLASLTDPAAAPLPSPNLPATSRAVE